MIIQFGTSRFLQAHVDLFLSEALRPAAGQGPVTVVQTTNAPERSGRVAAFDAGRFPVRLRGLREGVVVDRTVEVTSVSRGLAAGLHWPEIERRFVEDATTVVSNTGDRGYEPAGFPAKLLSLLHARWRAGGTALDLYPCELIGSNGDVLRGVVATLAHERALESGFREWLVDGCRWINSLVDRIVSAPIEPLGAIAEPYALWAIEAREDVAPPCAHADIVVTDRLVDHERLKLLILNLGHTALVERWRAAGAAPGLTVRDAIGDRFYRDDLDALYDDEVMPVFEAIGMGERAFDYRRSVMERFANPFLDHLLAEIAINHEAKRERRFGALAALAGERAPALRQPRIRAALGRSVGR